MNHTVDLAFDHCLGLHQTACFLALSLKRVPVCRRSALQQIGLGFGKICVVGSCDDAYRYVGTIGFEEEGIEYLIVVNEEVQV